MIVKSHYLIKSVIHIFYHCFSVSTISSNINTSRYDLCCRTIYIIYRYDLIFDLDKVFLVRTITRPLSSCVIKVPILRVLSLTYIYFPLFFSDYRNKLLTLLSFYLFIWLSLTILGYFYSYLNVVRQRNRVSVHLIPHGWKWRVRVFCLLTRDKDISKVLILTYGILCSMSDLLHPLIFLLKRHQNESSTKTRYIFPYMDLLILYLSIFKSPLCVDFILTTCFHPL